MKARGIMLGREVVECCMLQPIDDKPTQMGSQHDATSNSTEGG